VPPLPFHAIQDHSAFAMTGTKEASRVQWMWRLLFSALLCLPAIFMLVAGTWNERPGVSSEPRYGSGAQLYSSMSASLTISLPKAQVGPVLAGLDQSQVALNLPAPVSTPPPGPQRSGRPHRKVEVWYSASPKQEAQTLLHWRLTSRPSAWIPGPNQDSGG
jgi:hypothetical protein